MTIFGLRPRVAMTPRLARSANTLRKGRWSPEGPSSPHPIGRRLRSRYSPPSLGTSGRNAPSGAAPLPLILLVNHGPCLPTDSPDVVGSNASRAVTAPGLFPTSHDLGPTRPGVGLVDDLALVRRRDTARCVSFPRPDQARDCRRSSGRTEGRAGPIVAEGDGLAGPTPESNSLTPNRSGGSLRPPEISVF
jgi:hypothetical protein